MKDHEIYIEHLRALCPTEPSFFGIPSEPPPVTVIAFAGWPELGWTTSFSYGLSIIPHPAWTSSRPELVVYVRSDDPAWATLPGIVAAGMRGASPFEWGLTIEAGRPLAGDTAMDSLLVYAPKLFEPTDTRVRLARYAVHLARLYPIYEGEAKLIHRIGVDAFIGDDRIDFADPQRPDSSAGE